MKKSKFVLDNGCLLTLLKKSAAMRSVVNRNEDKNSIKPIDLTISPYFFNLSQFLQKLNEKVLTR